MTDRGALLEGFAHAYASRVNNEYSPTAFCSFNYYKDVVLPPLFVTAKTPVILSCRTQVRFMENYCAESELGFAAKATEWDYLGFVYSVNTAVPAEVTTFDDFAAILARTCTGERAPTLTRRCASDEPTHWSRLRDRALEHFSPAPPAATDPFNPHYVKFRDSGTNYGINH